jgi:hypothetical protein
MIGHQRMVEALEEVKNRKFQLYTITAGGKNKHKQVNNI